MVAKNLATVAKINSTWYINVLAAAAIFCEGMGKMLVASK